MFHQVPKGIYRNTAMKLSLRDRNSFVRACRLFRDSAQNDLNVEKLFFYAKYGQLKPAVAMIEAAPDLLLERLTFWDASNVRLHVNRTILQFLLGSQDIEFCHALIPLFTKLGNAGESIMLKQMTEQFPDQSEKVDNTAEFFAELNAIVAAFIAASESDIEKAIAADYGDSSQVNPLIIAIQKFKDYLRQEVEVTKGIHFDIAKFQSAVAAYDTHYIDVQDIYFFGSIVIGEMIALLPRRYQFACWQGLHGILNKNEELKRPLICDYRMDSICRNTQKSPGYVLGLNCFVDFQWGQWLRVEDMVQVDGIESIEAQELLNTYIDQTTIEFQRLCTVSSNKIKPNF